MTLALEVQGLGVDLPGSGADIVEDFSVQLEAGEILGLVGESGSGKTTVGMAMLNHVRRGARISSGIVSIAGVDILALDDHELMVQRGKLVAYIPQDPATALNPALRVLTQLREVLDIHEPGLGKDKMQRRLEAVLEDVRLPSDGEFLRRFPHQLSGGQQQRVTIAMAFLLNPRAIVLDEPTTGLDVTTQAHVLRTVREMCKANGVAAVYITHDLAAIAELADRILVLYAGRIAELGTRDDVLQATGHPYSARLIEAVPDIKVRRALRAIPGAAPAPDDRPTGCFFHPRCALAEQRCRDVAPPAVKLAGGHISYCYRASDVAKQTADLQVGQIGEGDSANTLLSVERLSCAYGSNRVLHSVSFDVGPRECVAIVGESGSGKTTLVRAIAGLVGGRQGTIRMAGKDLAIHARDRTVDERQTIQYVFQNPYASLNPRRTIGEIVERPLAIFKGIKGSAARPAVVGALDRVFLPSSSYDKYPDQLSGGERQRVAIARALICDPELLICDEITSALDVSVQAAIIDLLQSLMQDQGLALLFVTHNLALVRSLAGRTLVLNKGEIVEEGRSHALLDAPQAQYTQTLLADTPSL